MVFAGMQVMIPPKGDPGAQDLSPTQCPWGWPPTQHNVHGHGTPKSTYRGTGHDLTQGGPGAQGLS